MKQNEKNQEMIDKLAEDLANYEIFFNNSTEGFFIHRDGKFIIANNAFLKIFNITENDIINHTIYDFLSRESVIKAKENVKNKFEGEYEITGLKRNYGEVNLMVRSKEIIYRNKPARAVFIWDVTDEKKRIQEAIQKQEQIEQYRKILVSLAKIGIKANIYYEDTISNIIEIVSYTINAQFGGFFVLTDDNEFLRPIGLYGIYDENDVLIKFESIKECEKNRVNIIQDENNIKKIFPRVKFTNVDLIVAPVRYEGEFIGMTIFARNKERRWGRHEQDFIASVSDMIMLAFERWNRKLVEDELNSAISELKKSNKVKSDFISMISHELRTPLTSIIGFVSLMLNGAYGKLTEQQIDCINSIEQNSARLLKLINELLDMSRIEKGTFAIAKEKVDMAEIINKVLDDMQVILKLKKVNLVKNFAGKEFVISGDKNKLMQVINNLIDNAIKYSDKEIKIRINVEKLSKDKTDVPQDIKNSLRNVDYLMIKITDNGIGMEKENLQNIFNMFTQLENIEIRKYGGIGLGLYISRQIIEQHNGFIWAESEGRGKGTSFNILLPVG
ncbi:MAG: PAS domain S-box protein [Candidatus Goldbacteria bacterium]|nr:PAS domain S-box protein [Candidatus Goldiibacteriota bacterium]